MTACSANATLADYLVPVNADVRDLDVVFAREPDKFSPVGTKGVSEVGIVGVPAAIAWSSSDRFMEPSGTVSVLQ
jgi:CO/xanthine dehydrogenase Mo-binding subunit